MTTFLLTIEYDGTNYHGWQVQAMGHSSVQEAIENALAHITGHPRRLHASGRTDAGVHALAQTAHFAVDQSSLTPLEFTFALNSLLPPDIRILSCVPVPSDFHARFSAVRKTYRYCYNTRSIAPAIGRQYAWHVKKSLDVAKMQSAAQYLVGEHDFAAFEGAGSPRPHTLRTIFETHVIPENDRILFTITGNGFLRFMARNIAGTLAEIGTGKREPSELKSILDSADRTLAGITAPPHGLFLVAVEYDPDPRKNTV